MGLLVAKLSCNKRCQSHGCFVNNSEEIITDFMAHSFHTALSCNIRPVGSSIGQAIWVGTRFTVLEKVEFAFLSWRVSCQKRDESPTFKSNCLAASATRAECATEVYHRDRDFHSLLGKASLKEWHLSQGGYNECLLLLNIWSILNHILASSVSRVQLLYPMKVV